MDTPTLSAHDFKAVLVPECGGLVRSLMWSHAGRTHDLLYAAPDKPLLPSTIHWFGLWPLVPFANRAFGATLLDGDRRIDLPRNDPRDPAGTIHGFGWQAPWALAERSGEAATMVHRRTEGPDPYRYEARMGVRLDPGAVTIDLSVTNEADEPLPYGIGLHPWFDRDADTEVRCEAARIMRLAPDYRPLRAVPVPPDLDLKRRRAVPRETEFVASYVGASGEAEIVWPDRGLALRLESSATLRCPLVWMPADAPYFCIEPQSHAVGAPSEAVAKAVTPLARLSPGETLSGRVRLVPEASPSG
jgi:aldose 1-epimerase